MKYYERRDCQSKETENLFRKVSKVYSFEWVLKGRLSKDLESYKKEKESEENQISEMKQKQADEYEIRQLVVFF